MGSRTPEEYYYILWDYHVTVPSAITPLQVLAQFLATVPNDLLHTMQMHLTNCAALPNQDWLLKIIRSYATHGTNFYDKCLKSMEFMNTIIL